MIQKFLIALLLTGSVLAFAGQPEPQVHGNSNVLLYAGGRSYLGIDVRDVSPDRVSALKLKEERGVEIVMVDQDAPAGKAGLKDHDVILDYNGTRIEGEEQLRRLLRETPPGRNITLGISRDGSPMQIHVQVGDRGKVEANSFARINPRDHMLEIMPPEMPDLHDLPQIFNTYAPSLGMQIDNVGQQLGEFFGLKNGEGVLVKSVEKGSAAEKAGIKAGDVIVRADNEKISDRTDLRRILRSHREAGKITLGIVRDKREQNVTVDVPEARRPRDNGFQFAFPDIETINDLRSTLDSEIQTELRQLQPQLRKIQAELKPELQKTLRNTQSQMQQLRKQLEQEMKILNKQMNQKWI